MLAKRYNVSSAAILQANGTRDAHTLSRSAADHSAPDAAVAAPVLAPPPASRSRRNCAADVHIVNRGDTLISIAHRNHVSVAELAKANNLDMSAKLSLGMKLTVPGARAPLP